MWNGKDAILKERAFGLTGPEGNHGEDVKEYYYFLDSTPTHSYMKALYKYPQNAFPYADLVHENARRRDLPNGRDTMEYELLDTGVFHENRYFDVTVEYAKGAPEDILIRITAANRGPETAELLLLPTLWFRNNWSWNPPVGESQHTAISYNQQTKSMDVAHDRLGTYSFTFDPPSMPPLFTDNETNLQRLFNTANRSQFVKDAFHRYFVNNETGAVNPAAHGDQGRRALSAVDSAGRVAFDPPASHEIVCGADSDRPGV